MKLFCSLLLLLLYLAVAGRPSDAQLLRQVDASVSLQYRREGDPGLELQAGSNSIDATWDEVSGASYYNISWTPDGNGPNTVDGTSSSGTYTYTITGLVPCTKYTVTVQPGDKETDVGGPLTASTTTLPRDSVRPRILHSYPDSYCPSQTNITLSPRLLLIPGTLSPPDPYPVTTVTVATVVDQSSQLAVSWTKAGGAGNCAVTYRITWTPASGGGSRQDTTSALSYTITGLAACTTYTVCVTASTDGGYYTNDRCSSGTTDVDTPGPVVMSPLVPLSESSLRVAWDRPFNFKCEILFYTVKWTVNDTHKSDTTTTTSYTITGLAACSRYTVTVAAATSKGLGDETSESGATDSIAPDPPKSLGAAMVVNESDKLSVNWTQPDDPGPLCPVTRYTVTWYLASTQELVDQTTNSDTTLTISDLEAWTSYTVCVAAATEQNSIYKYSPPSCTNATTDQDTPGAPSNTRIQSHTGGSLLVVWSPPEEPRGIITSYSVAWSPPDTGNGTEVIVAGSVTQYYITSLNTCVNYTVTVRAATCKGYGEKVDINNTTDAPPPPSPPVTCKKVVSPNQLTVTWSPVDTQCTVSGYKVDYTGDVLWSNDTRHCSKELQTTYADLGDLTPWTTYTVCVAAVVVNDIVGAWNCCSSTTLEAAPGPPAALTIASVSSKTVTVSWAPPEELNGVLTDYQVAWDNGYTNLTANVTTYTVSDLQPKSQFTVAVKARTAAGWGPAAAVSGATADDGVNVGAVVGGVVGGLLLLALLVAAVFFRHKIMDTFQAAKHTRPPPAGPPPVTIVHPGDQVKKDVMTHDPAHIHALYSGSADPRALREEVTPHKAPSVQSPGGLALNTVTTHPYSDHTYVNEISDEDDPIYMSLD
nr:phosphatidylinositol phosphatase PTPRQ-like [Procambarus clarkii]